MSSTLKPPFHPELALISANFPAFPEFTRENVTKIRKSLNVVMGNQQKQTLENNSDIVYEDIKIPGPGGELTILVIRPKNSSGKAHPALVYFHGGGMMLGTRYGAATGWIFDWVTDLNAIIFSVEYRMAPEYAHPDLVEDCYAALKYVSDHTSEFGLNPEKIIVAGPSAGGNLATSTALLSRDRGGPKLCAQLLIYPMLDDRNTSVSTQQFAEDGTWKKSHNLQAWSFLLGDKVGTDEVPIYAAPSRAKDLSGLPPTFIEVGSCDIFRDENIAYASKLWEHGVSTELHVWSGAWHGYDGFAPGSAITKASLQVRMRWAKDTVL